MSSARSIVRNAAFLCLARVISTLLKFFLFIYVARLLGDALLGKFTFALVFATFFSVFTSLGMDDLLVREVARDRKAASRYIGNMLVMKIGLSVVVFALIVGAVSVMGYPGDTRLAVTIFAGYAVFSSLSAIFRAVFRAFESMAWDAMLEVLESVVVIAAGLVLLFRGFGLIELCLVFLAASILNLAISLRVCYRKFARFRLEFDARFLMTALKSAIPFCVSLLFILYTRVDTVLLSAMKGDAIVGDYNAAYQIVLAFDPLVLTFMMALMPVLSRLFVSSSAMLQVAYEKSVKYLLFLGFPVAVGGTILADRIIPFLYGPGFDNSVLALQILIWNSLLTCLNRPMLFMLGAVNRQGTGAIIAVAAILLSVVLNYLMIPLWSFVGAGFTSLAVSALVTGLAWYAVSRNSYNISIVRAGIKSLAASVVMGLVLYLAVSTTGNLFILVALGLITYAATLYLVKGLSDDDRYLFKQALGFLPQGNRARSV